MSIINSLFSATIPQLLPLYQTGTIRDLSGVALDARHGVDLSLMYCARADEAVTRGLHFELNGHAVPGFIQNPIWASYEAVEQYICTAASIRSGLLQSS